MVTDYPARASLSLHDVNGHTEERKLNRKSDSAIGKWRESRWKRCPSFASGVPVALRCICAPLCRDETSFNQGSRTEFSIEIPLPSRFFAALGLEAKRSISLFVVVSGKRFLDLRSKTTEVLQGCPCGHVFYSFFQLVGVVCAAPRRPERKQRKSQV